MENLYTQRNILTFYVLYYVGSMQLLLKFILIHNALQHAIIIKIHCHTLPVRFLFPKGTMFGKNKKNKVYIGILTINITFIQIHSY